MRADGGGRRPAPNKTTVGRTAATLRVPETRAEQHEGVFAVNREIPQSMAGSLQSEATWL